MTRLIVDRRLVSTLVVLMYHHLLITVAQVDAYRLVYFWSTMQCRINGVVVTWVVAIDPPGVRFPLNALLIFILVKIT